MRKPSNVGGAKGLTIIRRVKGKHLQNSEFGKLPIFKDREI